MERACLKSGYESGLYLSWTQADRSSQRRAIAAKWSPNFCITQCSVYKNWSISSLQAAGWILKYTRKAEFRSWWDFCLFDKKGMVAYFLTQYWCREQTSAPRLPTMSILKMMSAYFRSFLAQEQSALPGANRFWGDEYHIVWTASRSCRLMGKLPNNS